MVSLKTPPRAWFVEPLIAIPVAVVLAGGWLAVIVAQETASGTPSAWDQDHPGSPGWIPWLLTLVEALTVLIPWAAITAGLNLAFARQAKAPRRIVFSWLAADMLATPFIVAQTVGLNSDAGWRGLGVFGLAITIVVPLAAFPVYAIAYRLAGIRRRTSV